MYLERVADVYVCPFITDLDFVSPLSHDLIFVAPPHFDYSHPLEVHERWESLEIVVVVGQVDLTHRCSIDALGNIVSATWRAFS